MDNPTEIARIRLERTMARACAAATATHTSNTAASISSSVPLSVDDPHIGLGSSHNSRDEFVSNRREANAPTFKRRKLGSRPEKINEVRHHVGSLAKASWFSFYSICYSFPDNAPWESPSGDDLKSSDSSLWL